MRAQHYKRLEMDALGDEVEGRGRGRSRTPNDEEGMGTLLGAAIGLKMTASQTRGLRLTRLCTGRTVEEGLKARGARGWYRVRGGVPSSVRNGLGRSLCHSHAASSPLPPRPSLLIPPLNQCLVLLVHTPEVGKSVPENENRLPAILAASCCRARAACLFILGLEKGTAPLSLIFARRCGRRKGLDDSCIQSSSAGL